LLRRALSCKKREEERNPCYNMHATEIDTRQAWHSCGMSF
jgi:hypothetical protein